MSSRVEIARKRKDSIAETVRMYSDSILRLAFTYVKSRSDAEDIAQEVWMIYMRKAPRFASEKKRKSWLIQVTANRCRDYLRSAWRKRTQPLQDNLSYMPEEDANLISYVMAMEEKYRVPIHLFYYEGYTLVEIAEMLQSKPATVGTWLNRGRAILKSKIGVDLDEE